MDVIEQLQGSPLPASTLENEILPSRAQGFRTADLDELCIQGEVIWRGFDSPGPSDGRIGLFLTDHYPTLAPVAMEVQDQSADSIRELLRQQGALLFDQITAVIRQFPNDLLQLLWDMVWRGELTNDTLTPLRSLRAATTNRGKSESRTLRGFRSRRQQRLPGSEGRWSLLPYLATNSVSIYRTADGNRKATRPASWNTDKGNADSRRSGRRICRLVSGTEGDGRSR